MANSWIFISLVIFAIINGLQAEHEQESLRSGFGDGEFQEFPNDRHLPLR